MDSIRECSMTDCAKPHRGRGYCNAHLLKLQKTGSPFGRPRIVHTECGLDGCHLPYLAKGMCRPHYDREWSRKTGGRVSRPPVCLREECALDARAGRGLCHKHYAIEVRREKNPGRRETRKGSALDRITPELTVGICWEWGGSRNNNGYGTITVDKTRWYVHRLMWTALVGPIPKGMVLDHLCRNPICCNTDHLEVVTQKENMRRSRNDVRGRYA